ncbi:phage baseplate assembly protein V [Salmonella enterica subsp. enterica serovar Agbeni]|nr:phage baseplate assembly protein V [Salmonella enterica subsp. enterica serovar Agbeni]
MINKLARRLRLLVDRAVVRMVSDSFGRQNLQIQSLADATNDDVERFQNYGFSSVPPVGSEAIILSVGGRRESLVAVAVEDKTCRPQGLDPGDVCVYHQDGLSSIILKKGGKIEVRGKTVNYTADELFEINTAQLKVVGPSIFTQDINLMGVSLIKFIQTHWHRDGENRPTTPPVNE